MKGYSELYEQEDGVEVNGDAAKERPNFIDSTRHRIAVYEKRIAALQLAIESAKNIIALLEANPDFHEALQDFYQLQLF